MQGYKIIQREHRAIAAVVHCLEQVLKEVRDGKLDPPFELFDLVIRYVRDFPDRFHHPKEDEYLFPHLIDRAPETAALIEELQDEHAEGLHHTAALAAALQRYRDDPKTGFSEFDQAATDFIAFQRNHIALEEKKIMPVARDKLTAEDWAEIDAAFADNEDPIFGVSPKDEFDHLFSAIVANAPEPWGLKTREPKHGEDEQSFWDAMREKVVNLHWV